MMAQTTIRTLRDNLRTLTQDAKSLTGFCKTANKMRPAPTMKLTSPEPNELPQKPPTLRPKLPIEILDIVFSFLSIESLRSLLLANSFISALSMRRLYHTVVLNHPYTIIGFFKTVLANEALPPLVRGIDITMSKSTPVSNFYLLFHNVLQQTKGLISLSLDLPKGHAPFWMFEGCTFKLRQFTTSMYCRRPLASYLESQDSIVDLTLRGYQTDTMFFLPFIDPVPPSMLLPPAMRFTLSPEALPRLKYFNAVHADAYVIQAVVKGRPVECVSIPLFPDMSLASLDALCTSTTPLRRLSVISFDPSAPDFLFEALAKRFDQLEALHLVMLMAEYNQELLEQSGELLSHFKRLKYITFMAASSSTAPLQPPAPPANNPLSIGAILNPVSSSTTPDADNANDNQDSQDTATSISEGASLSSPVSMEVVDTDEANIAKQWHRACPTLKTIILPKGKVWFQNTQDGPSSSGTDEDGSPSVPMPSDEDSGMDTMEMGPVEEPEWSAI